MDFFGKLVPAHKFRASISYLMNLAMEVEPTAADWKWARATFEQLRDEHKEPSWADITNKHKPAKPKKAA